jgi:membrane protease YdiL (CAAX protease family)
MKISRSMKIFVGLIVVLAILSVIGVLLPQGAVPSQGRPAPNPLLVLADVCVVLILYGGLGFVGIKLSRKLDFPDLWEPRISNKQRFLIPAIIGVAIGVFFILTAVILQPFNSLGPLPHPTFPLSLVASAAAAIGEEIIFRLFFISFLVWLISRVILKGRWQNQVFWTVAVLSAISFALGHIPSVMILFGLKSITEISPVIMTEIILLNGVVSLFAAYYFRKYGFLAAVGIHFWTDVIWHVIWGVV